MGGVASVFQREFDSVAGESWHPTRARVRHEQRAKLLWAAAFLLGFLFACATSAEAHTKRTAASTAGLSIPNLSHGQLRVMATYKNAILDLANREPRPDAEARTLQNFINLQFTYCLWGLVPGSLGNEDSPFNGCTHAYLAASKALLHRLERTSSNPSPVRDLAMRISVDMIREESALEICANGVEPFNTADIIMPEWSGVPFNPIVVLYSSIAFLVTAGLFAIYFARRPRSVAGSA
jgi:hypothetical protein